MTSKIIAQIQTETSYYLNAIRALGERVPKVFKYNTPKIISFHQELSYRLSADMERIEALVALAESSFLANILEDRHLMFWYMEEARVFNMRMPNQKDVETEELVLSTWLTKTCFVLTTMASSLTNLLAYMGSAKTKSTLKTNSCSLKTR